MASHPQGTPDPRKTFDPTNRNDPRYDPRLDPQNDPRWQREQNRAWRRTQKAQQESWNAQQKAWTSRQRDAFRAQQQAYRDQIRAQVRIQREQARAWRRATQVPSVIGPVLLIAFASVVLLLHSGYLPWPAFLLWYRRWWPVLLIGIGILRLAEWGIDRAMHRDRQIPMRYNVGAGVGLAVFLLVAAGFAAKGLTRYDGKELAFNAPFLVDPQNLEQFFGSKHEEDISSIVHNADPGASLLIQNPQGDVTVTGTSDDGMIHLSIHKEVWTSSDKVAHDRLHSLTPEFHGPGNNLSLKVNETDSGKADLTLLVPPGLHVNINANHGDVHASNLKAPILLTANHGEVDVAAITGAVDVRVNSRNKSLSVRSISGPLEIQGTGDEVNLSGIDGPVKLSGDFFGGGRLQHVTGPISYHTSRISFSLERLAGEVAFDDGDEFSASDAAGPLTLQTRSRDITLSRIAGDINVTNSHGKVEIIAVPPSGAITVNNRQGDVSVALPQKTSFTVMAETSDGDIRSSFPVSGKNQTRGSLNGTVGGGGNPIRITTTHGDIAIEHNEEPALPTPPAPPKIGFGSVPPPPPPPGMPGGSADRAEVSRELQAARKQVEEAQQEAARAARSAVGEQKRELERIQKQQAKELRKIAAETRSQMEKQAQGASKSAGDANPEP